MQLEINGHTIETEDYVKKWIDWALEATQATDEEVTKNVQWLYKQAKLQKPEVVVFRNYDEFINYNWASVKDSVSVWASVGASVKDSVSVGSSVKDSVSVGSSVKASVWDSVGDSVGVSVWASVKDSVSVWASVGASVWDSVGVSVGAWYWADDLSFVDVFSDTKVLSEEKRKKLKKYKEALSTQCLAVYTEKTCYVLVAPIIRRNEEGQLHSTEELAVDWNGTGLYYLDGIEFKKEWWSKIVNDELSPEEVLAIDNIEHRRIAWKYMDKKKLEGLESFKVLDEVKDDGKGYLMRIISFKHPDVDKPLKYYNCFCPSTGREYYIGTKETTCEKAKTQSFGFDEVEFINEW